MSYILSVDVGTTTIRCHVYNENAVLVFEAKDELTVYHPQPQYVEMNPAEVWAKFKAVVLNSISGCGITASQVSCLAISTQRNTFTTWDRATGSPFHPFITWADRRASDLVKCWNNSVAMKALRFGGWFLHKVTGSKRFLAASVLKLMNTQITMRLYWALNNIDIVKEKLKDEMVYFGTIDTWLLYNLTNGRLHATDYSNAAATGMFDPFTLTWADWGFGLFSIPKHIMPIVMDTAGHFGCCDSKHFGAEIPIACVMADQSASVFGEFCFNIGDIKLTMGTGSFLDINTGQKPHASIKGLYPVIGWKFRDVVTYIAEGHCSNTGIAMNWGAKSGLFKDVCSSEEVAVSVSSSDGVYFVPSFHGLQAPVDDPLCACGFIGLKLSTTRAHMARALLESIAFIVCDLYEKMKEEADFPFTSMQNHTLIRVDGGVSNNDLILQLISNLTNTVIQRLSSFEMSARGAAFLAGLEIGVWKDFEELKEKFLCVSKSFYPNKEDQMELRKAYVGWKQAVERFRKWHS